jgi:hypothetical protein
MIIDRISNQKGIDVVKMKQHENKEVENNADKDDRTKPGNRPISPDFKTKQTRAE